MRPGRGARFDRSAHERRPVNPVAQLRAAGIQAPDQWHAVRYEMVEAAGDFAELRIVAPEGDDVGVGEVDRMRSAAPGELLGGRDERRVGGGEERGPEQVESSHRFDHPRQSYRVGWE